MKREFLDEVNYGDVLALKKSTCPEVRAFEVLDFNPQTEMWMLQDIVDDFVLYQPDSAISRKKSEKLQCLNQATKRNSAKAIERLKELHRLTEKPVKLSIKENWVKVLNTYNVVADERFHVLSNEGWFNQTSSFEIVNRFFLKKDDGGLVPIFLIDLEATEAENIQ